MFVFILVCLGVAGILGALLCYLEYGSAEPGVFGISGLMLAWMFYALAVIFGFGKGSGPLQGGIAFIYACSYALMYLNLRQLERQRALGLTAARAR